MFLKSICSRRCLIVTHREVFQGPLSIALVKKNVHAWFEWFLALGEPFHLHEVCAM